MWDTSKMIILKYGFCKYPKCGTLDNINIKCLNLTLKTNDNVTFQVSDKLIYLGVQTCFLDDPC